MNQYWINEHKSYTCAEHRSLSYFSWGIYFTSRSSKKWYFKTSYPLTIFVKNVFFLRTVRLEKLLKLNPSYNIYYTAPILYNIRTWKQKLIKIHKNCNVDKFRNWPYYYMYSQPVSLLIDNQTVTGVSKYINIWTQRNKNGFIHVIHFTVKHTNT